MGRELAREHPAQADLVIGVPGFRCTGGHRLRPGDGVAAQRGPGQEPVRRKDLHPTRPAFAGGRHPVEVQSSPRRGEGQRVVVVDDYRAGQHDAEHRRAAPPWRGHRNPPTHFIATHRPSVPFWYRHGRARRLSRTGGTSTGFVATSAQIPWVSSLEGLLRAVGERHRCLGCLTGHYPCRLTVLLKKTLWSLRKPLSGQSSCTPSLDDGSARDRERSRGNRDRLRVLVVGWGAREHALVWALYVLRRLSSFGLCRGIPASPRLRSSSTFR